MKTPKPKRWISCARCWTARYPISRSIFRIDFTPHKPKGTVRIGQSLFLFSPQQRIGGTLQHVSQSAQRIQWRIYRAGFVFNVGGAMHR